MPFLKVKCKECGKLAVPKNEYLIAGIHYSTLECGHILKDSKVELQNKPEDLRSIDDRALFAYQNTGVKFAINSGVKCLIADDMGIGKTPQALATLAMNESELLPVVFVVKSSLTVQWQRESMRWLGEDFLAQIIETSGDYLLDGFKGYIISYDLLGRFRTKDGRSNRFVEMCLKRGIKTIILDECQQIKNTESARSREVRELCGITEHVIALSGTPIKNNAEEYFSILNILRPQYFPSKEGFRRRWIGSWWDGNQWQRGGLANVDRFLELTKDFIIRREKKDVLPDLPKIQRQYSFHEMSEAVQKQYDKHLADLQESQESGEYRTALENQANILAYISKMRYLVGMSKIDPCIDKCMEFLGSSSAEKKLVIFLHHKDVHEVLKLKLNKVLDDLELDHCLSLTSDLNVDQRSKIVEDFQKNSKKRILIASTLASGEGLDGLQKVCDYIIMLERQWNPSAEEQVEGRISRIGQESSSLTALYLVAVGTIDEFFSRLVEQKRQIIGTAMTGEATNWNESSIMKELVETLMQSGKKSWRF